MPVLHDIARVLGSVALQMVLLCVGANLTLRRLAGSRRAIGLATVDKFLVNPIAVVCTALLLSPDLLVFQAV